MRKSISFVLKGGDPQSGIGGQLVLSEDVLLYDAFREVYEYDKSDDKLNAFADLKYARFMGEEEGAFSHLDGHERRREVTLECYGTVAPKLEKERRDLRDHAVKMFQDYEETSEGRTLAMLDAQIHDIQKMLELTKKAPGDIKDDKALEAYMESRTKITTNLLNLTKQRNAVFEQITKQGGRRKVKKVADAPTSLNELGHFGRDQVLKRRRASEEENAATTTASN